MDLDGGSLSVSSSYTMRFYHVTAFHVPSYFCRARPYEFNASFHVMVGSSNRTAGLYSGRRTLDMGTDYQVVRAKSVTIHPHLREPWSSKIFQNDVALIELESPLVIDGTLVNSICLPEGGLADEPQIGEVVEISGWGLTGDDSEFGPVKLRAIQAQRVEKGRCPKGTGIGADFICFEPSACHVSISPKFMCIASPSYRGSLLAYCAIIEFFRETAEVQLLSVGTPTDLSSKLASYLMVGCQRHQRTAISLVLIHGCRCILIGSRGQ